MQCIHTKYPKNRTSTATTTSREQTDFTVNREDADDENGFLLRRPLLLLLLKIGNMVDMEEDEWTREDV
jgi:hypothetical protein